jgi:hypothetical protein
MPDFAAIPGNRADNAAIRNVVVGGNTLGSSSSNPRRVLSVNATGNITAGWTAGSLRLSVQPQTGISGVSAGTTSATSGTVVFSNSNGVSFGLNGQTVTGSIATSLTNINVSAGTTSNNLSALTFSNANNVSFGLNASTVTGSVATSLTNVNVSAGTTSNNLSALTFSNANNVSFGLNASTVTASIATSLTNVNISAGTTSNNLSAVVFSNSNGVSFGLNGSTVTGSVATSLTNVNVSAGTTSNNLSALVFSNSNGVTFGLNGSTVTASVAAGGGAGFTAGNSNIGNTSGDTGVVTGRLVLAGGNNITLSGSTNAGSMTLTISAPNLGAGAFSGGASNLGNTAGSTGATGTRMAFVGSGVVSLSQSTDANGGTLSINAPATSSLSATGGVSISTNGSTISIGAPAAISINYWNNIAPDTSAGAQTNNLTASSRSLFMFPLDPVNEVFPGNITASTARLLVSVGTPGSTSQVTGVHTFGISLGVYQISATNSQSTLSLLNSVGYTFTNTTISSSAWANSYQGIRWLSFHSSAWSASPTFSAGGRYLGALLFSWSGITHSTLAPYGQFVIQTFNASGDFGAASVTNTSRGFRAYAGIYTATTVAFPASVHVSQLNKQASNANWMPYIEFDALNSVH